MKPNPGGQIAPSEVIGRDQLILQLWETLEGRSIYMNDLRRIGKTQIMVKMHAEPPGRWLAVKRDVGGSHTAAEFATQAYRDSEQLLGARKRSLRKMGDLLGALKGAEIAGVLKLPDGSPAPWKEVLTRTFADLDEEMAAMGDGARVVFLWDEVPFLLDNIARREGHAVAMEVLDVLRALGQDYDRVRLLLTGSIGLHHVLGDLREKGYINSPLNRMEHVQPGPLALPDAIALSRALLIGEAGRACIDVDACSEAIARSTGGVAFYIHKLVTRLPREVLLAPDLIEAALDREVCADNDDWDFTHYRNRLGRYYREDEKLALAVLDAIAVESALSFAALRTRVASTVPLEDDERLRGLLDLLCRDHYLERKGDNQFRFYLPLVRRWWRFHRGLEGAAS